MKKHLCYLLLFGLLGFCTTTLTTGCKTKEGCGLEEKYAPPTNKDGSLSTKRGKSNLFSKKQRKRMKKRGKG